MGYRPPLSRSKSQLRAASLAVERMRAAKSFQDFEAAWGDFLDAVEKVWKKCERECQGVKKEFQPWQARFNSERGSDPLLSYLRHARNADNHSIQEIVQHIPGSSMITSSGPGPLYIERLEIRDGQITEYSGNQPLIQRTTPSRVEPLRIVDRGVTYDPPREHLGRALDRRDPLAIAEAGLTYYTKFVEEAHARFFGRRA
jgi:hypothetical protein